MAERAKRDPAAAMATASRTVGVAATGAMRQFDWLWGRESLLRLVLSLLLAVGLWLYVTGKNNPSSVDLLQPISITPSFIGVGDTVTNVLPNVHIRYKSDNPNTVVTAANFQAEVNLLKRGPGLYPRVPVTVTSTNLGVDVVQVSPATVPVVVDRLISQQVQVVAHYLNRSLPSGYNAGTPTFTPSSITVSGPRSIVKQAYQAEVNLTLSGNRSSILALFKPFLVDARGSPVATTSQVSLSPSDVQVSVPIKAVASFKSLPLLVPLRGHPRTGFGVVSVTVSPSEITAKGLPSILSQLSTASTAQVDLTGQPAGNITRHVAVTLPKGVSSDTKGATVTIQLRPVDASTSTEIGVRLQSVGPGLVAHLRPGKVLVTVVGPSASLSKVARGLSAVLDLSGFGAGIYQLTPHVTPPPGFTLVDVYPKTVSVLVQSATLQ